MKYTDYYNHLIHEILRGESDDYYYHVTLAPHVDNILQNGLRINKKPTVSNYRGYSRGKIFLCDIGVVDWWKFNIEQHAFDQHDDERFHNIAVLKIKKDKLTDVHIDTVGSEDSRGNCYYVTNNIPADVIEIHESGASENNLNESLVDKKIIDVPKEPGTVPIPSNHLRLYHYTNTTSDELQRDGLLMSKAKGHTYGEPDFVWASLKKPSDYKTYVEFSVPIDDPRFSIWGSKPDVSRGVEFYADGSDDFTFRGDIKPDEFIAIHEPWHHAYRYIVDENPEMIPDVLAGKYDYLLDKSSANREAKAIKAIKANYGN
jgi:hypothetical protein